MKFILLVVFFNILFGVWLFLGIVWFGLVVVELMGVSEGVGYMIMDVR